MNDSIIQLKISSALVRIAINSASKSGGFILETLEGYLIPLVPWTFNVSKTWISSRELIAFSLELLLIANGLINLQSIQLTCFLIFNF